MALSDETLFISTTPGLEPALELECRALGFKDARAEPGGVNVSGAAGLHRELNVRLRTASRVLLRVAELEASSDRSLSDELKKVALSPFIARGSIVDLSASVHHAKLRAERVEQLAREVWKFTAPPPRTREEEELPDASRVQLRVEGGRCVVSVDTSGDLLYRRGYRQEVSHAPLRETLAAGMLILAGYDGAQPLADPMCGSGTILIEAALIAQHRAPGLERSFAFEKFPSFDEGTARDFEELKARLRSKETRPSFKFRGSDIHSGALGAARRNGKRAAVQDLLELERKDVAAARFAGGFVISNPPYGKRVGDKQDLGALYENIGNVLRASPGVRFGLLIVDEALEKRLRIPVEHVHRLSNGGIWCRYLVGTVPA